MPLTKLSIREFRGIRELDLSTSGKNIAVVGPNGSGKSSLADSVDFLLTGQIKRLTGEGAGGLSLAKHGPNVKANPLSAVVEAEFITRAGENVVLRRTTGSPELLSASGPIPDEVQRVLDLARSGSQHMLTRREILRYIFTEPAKRGEQVAALLHLTTLDTLRKELQGASKLAADEARQSAAVRDTRRGSVLRSFDPPAAQWDVVIDKINSHRGTLGAAAVTALDPPDFRAGVVEPAKASHNPLQSRRTRDLLGTMTAWFREGAGQFSNQLVEYVKQVRSAQADSSRLKSLRSVELLRIGLGLATEDECPLCLREWRNPELRDILEARLSDAGEAESGLRELRNLQSQLRATLSSMAAVARSLGEQIQPSADSAAKQFLDFSRAVSQTLQELVPDPLTEALRERVSGEVMQDVAPNSVLVALAETEKQADALPDLSGIQRAWDELSAAETAIREFEGAVIQQSLSERAARELAAADKLFVASRDAVLQRTYDAIAARFADLYGKIHSDDEGSFKASLNPTKAGLTLGVDFYGLGEYPPCAVHSEGHQDSMGLCLFLTLTEYLAGGPVPFLILDDVLMSVDREHRRAVANLLKTEFADCQFLITTHDRVWWRQLRTLGLVSGKGAVEFKSWTLMDGPAIVIDAGKMLGEAAEALANKKVPSAAHALRRAVEAYLPDVCDALGARVRFRADAAWEAGDFLSSAIGRYGEIFGLARAAANSWNDKSTDWAALEERRKSAITGFNSETWAVNANVHFNDWADFTPADFAPVLNAYEALFALFFCDQCGASLRVIEEDGNPLSFRCDCAKTNWNLKQKGKP
jgi:energy-coupling factor transporter ATP-binding protein EcfA2